MRRKKSRMMIAAVVAVMLMSGCGEEPYTLTEQEEDLIVNYSAHVVTKYNAYQKEGLTYVWPEEEEEEDVVEQVATTPVPDTSTEQLPMADGTTPSMPVEVEPTLETRTLTELFGSSNITLEYVGARLGSSYVESGAYALYPDSGKQYLVIGIDITNTGKAVEQVDYLSANPKFEVTLNGEATSKSEMTILTQDFMTFEAKIAPGETRETVLVFQVPDTIASIESIKLVTQGENNYQIILENE